MGFFELAIALYIGVTIYIANLADLPNPIVGMKPPSYSTPPYRTIVQRMLYGLIVGLILFGGYTTSMLAVGLPDATLKELGINPAATAPASILTLTLILVLLGGLSFTLIASQSIRQHLRKRIGSKNSFNPDSAVHLVAMILSICLVGYLFMNFVVAGGLSGVAQSIQDDGLSIGTLIFQGILFVIIACLGIGLAIRRSHPESINRLGLTIPTPRNILISIFAGIALIALSLGMNAIWMLLVTPEVYAQQSAAAAAIESQITTVQSAFILSLTAAVSEEILFRGAIQPVFGIPLTTVFFVLFHSQYTLSPAMLIILTVGLGLAYLRRYQNTLSSIIAHFVYNFFPVTLVIILPTLAPLLGLK